MANKRLRTMCHNPSAKMRYSFARPKTGRAPLTTHDPARSLLAKFSGNPPYGMPAIEALIPQLIPHGYMTDDPSSLDEFKQVCTGKRKKTVVPDRASPPLVGYAAGRYTTHVV